MQLGINPAMDKLARENGLGHWSCTDPRYARTWIRSDGEVVCNYNHRPLCEADKYYYSSAIESMRGLDSVIPIGEDWQKPETEEEFLNRKLPCDIKIGCGTNKAGTTIKTLLLRADTIINGDKISVNLSEEERTELLELLKKSNPADNLRHILPVPLKPLTPTLVQKPFQYPCDGALYFTAKDRAQVFLTGFLNHHEKQVVGKLSNDKAGKFSFFDAKTGAATIGNTDNDLIMFVWEQP
jgi:hypothetical protein